MPKTLEFSAQQLLKKSPLFNALNQQQFEQIEQHSCILSIKSLFRRAIVLANLVRCQHLSLERVEKQRKNGYTWVNFNYLMDEMPLLVADTVIAGPEGELLRKAMNRDDAERILRLQSGNEISIISCTHLKSREFYFIDLSATHYLFAPFDEIAMQKYLDSGDWRGKAGACMVEGFCKPYIRKVVGLESTAMGLQVEKIIPWIES